MLGQGAGGGSRRAPPHHRSDLGRVGERAAEAWYTRRGYRVVARNWRSRLGELDLVLRRGDTVVFVEVKARTGTAFGGPYEAVGPRKRRKLRQLAEAFLAENGAAAACRFDVASVMHAARGGVDVHVFEDAF